MAETRCEGGCKRRWTFEWLHAETGQRWLLCDIHSSRSVDTLTELGYWAFKKPNESDADQLLEAL